MTDEEVVDEKAREDLQELREKLTGAKMVPSFSVLFRRMFQSLISWPGWEFFGLAILIAGCISFFVVIITVSSNGCTAQEQKFYSPVCEKFDMALASKSDGVLFALVTGK